jgi:hypothetical protein
VRKTPIKAKNMTKRAVTSSGRLGTDNGSVASDVLQLKSQASKSIVPGMEEKEGKE